MKLNEETFLPWEQALRRADFSRLHAWFLTSTKSFASLICRIVGLFGRKKANYATRNFVNIKSHAKRKICSQGKNFKRKLSEMGRLSGISSCTLKGIFFLLLNMFCSVIVTLLCFLLQTNKFESTAVWWRFLSLSYWKCMANKLNGILICSLEFNFTNCLK